MGRKSNYENGMYQQLMEIMGRLDTVEKESAQKIDTLIHSYRRDEYHIWKMTDICRS